MRDQTSRVRSCKRFEEAVECGGEQEREEDVGNEDAGEEEHTCGGEDS
jgi:hypothetical protein